MPRNVNLAETDRAVNVRLAFTVRDFVSNTGALEGYSGWGANPQVGRARIKGHIYS
jgi:hypothetical protein